MASRYGSMKQIESFGPAGETIMDYSIYDAIRAGFGKIVFIIREEFAEQFKSIFEPKLNGKIATDYVFQHLEDYTGGRTLPAERTKPWGTAHAVLCCKGKVNEPFAVINPVILRSSAEMETGWEGCLSVPGFRAQVPRHLEVDVAYTDRRGEAVTARFSGFMARLFQHEFDHLEGILYPERLPQGSALVTLDEFTALTGIVVPR